MTSLTPFQQLNDLVRLAVDFANDVYSFDDSDEKNPDLERTVTVKDHPSSVLGDGSRTYQVHCRPFQAKARELACLYLVEREGQTQKYAFLAWKGTNSWEQCMVDLLARFESPEHWKEHLQTICDEFLNPLSGYLQENQIEAKDYDWFTTGHSLGGALAAYSGYLLTCNPSLINGGRYVKSFTFAGMLLPVPLPLPFPLTAMPLPLSPSPDSNNNSQKKTEEETAKEQSEQAFEQAMLDFSTQNHITAFYNQQDRLVPFASEAKLRPVGTPRIDINYLGKDQRMYHLLINYLEFFEEHYIEIDEEDPERYRVIKIDEVIQTVFSFTQGIGDQGIHSMIVE